MSIPLRARAVDLVNLVIAKGSNFLLTVLLFGLISHGMDAHSFGEFGYWWSIAIMIGGILLGGISSALVRAIATYGSVRHLAGPLRHAGIGLGILVVLWGALLLIWPGHIELLLLLAAVGMFGLAVQAQAAVLGLLRALEATRANLVASILIVLLVPALFYFLLGTGFSMATLFLMLTFAFACGTCIAAVSARHSLRHLLVRIKVAQGSVHAFLATTLSFTAVNVFSYAIVNVDFTLFRFMGAPSQFAVMATGKVFFERFVLPALLVFAGAVSLRVLRHRGGADGIAVRLEMHFGHRLWIGALGVIAMLVLAYWIFIYKIRGDAVSIPLQWVACASAGYLLYAVNGILLDVMVVQRSLAVVAGHVAAFIVLSGLLQTIAIYTLGVAGWAIAWFCFNLIVTIILARNGLQVKSPVAHR